MQNPSKIFVGKHCIKQDFGSNFQHVLFTHSVMCNSATPWTTARQASLFFTISWSLLNSCLLSRWCHPTISASVTPFSSCLQSFPASGSFPVSPLFASGGQSFGASASASVLTMNIQGWLPLGLTSWISLQYKVLRCWNHTKSVIWSLWYYGRNQCQKIFENNPHIFKYNVTFTKRDFLL